MSEGAILIVGAGPVGLALALALQAQGQSLRLIDTRPAAAMARDQRVLALSHGSRQTLERLGAWPASGWTPIAHIHVSQQGALGRTELHAQDYALPALGYVMPAQTLHQALSTAAQRNQIHIEHGVSLCKAELDGTRILAHDAAATPHSAALLVHCEGQVSATQQDAAQWTRDYAQHAVIARARPQAPHQQRAYERFTGEGPLALLPLGEDYAVVWTCPPLRAQALLALDPAQFCAALQAAFGQRVHFLDCSERAQFPLGLRMRRSPIAARQVWVGNAAQTLHPVAGQGFNLALRDVWQLAQTVGNAADPGAAALLQSYARLRQLDRLGTAGFTDGLVRLFSNHDPLLQHLRGAGLLALDALPPLRHFVAKRMLFGARAWP